MSEPGVPPLAPAVAAERAGRPLDWEAINRSISIMSADSDVMIVEGVGGIRVPMDARHTFIEVAAWLGAPAVVVARAARGTIWRSRYWSAESLESPLAERRSSCLQTKRLPKKLKYPQQRNSNHQHLAASAIFRPTQDRLWHASANTPTRLVCLIV